MTNDTLANNSNLYCKKMALAIEKKCHLDYLITLLQLSYKTLVQDRRIYLDFLNLPKSLYNLTEFLEERIESLHSKKFMLE